MTKEDFLEVINKYQKIDKYADKLQEDLDIDVTGLPSIEAFWELFDMYIDNNFEERGRDIVMWWTCEKFADWNETPLEIYDENKNIIPTTSPEDLWNYVKDYVK